MLIHFSSDQILLSHLEHKVCVPFSDIERTFPAVLQEWYTTHTPTKITVINGPGSFTQLRVATIACNILNISQNNQIDFLDISKISLYEKAMKAGHLPPVGVIFMGQRKKMWLIEKPPELALSSSTPLTGGIQIVDQADALEKIDGREYFIDWMVGDHPVVDVLDREKMVDVLGIENGVLRMNFADTTFSIDISDLGELVKQLEPRYMMEPQVG